MGGYSLGKGIIVCCYVNSNRNQPGQVTSVLPSKSQKNSCVIQICLLSELIVNVIAAIFAFNNNCSFPNNRNLQIIDLTFIINYNIADQTNFDKAHQAFFGHCINRHGNPLQSCEQSSSTVHTNLGLPSIAELNWEAKTCLINIVRKCPIPEMRKCQPLVVINVEKSSAINKTRKQTGAGPY